MISDDFNIDFEEKEEYDQHELSRYLNTLHYSVAIFDMNDKERTSEEIQINKDRIRQSIIGITHLLEKFKNSKQILAFLSKTSLITDMDYILTCFYDFYYEFSKLLGRFCDLCDKQYVDESFVRMMVLFFRIDTINKLLVIFIQDDDFRGFYKDVSYVNTIKTNFLFSLIKYYELINFEHIKNVYSKNNISVEKLHEDYREATSIVLSVLQKLLMTNTSDPNIIRNVIYLVNNTILKDDIFPYFRSYFDHIYEVSVDRMLDDNANISAIFFIRTCFDKQIFRNKKDVLERICNNITFLTSEQRANIEYSDYCSAYYIIGLKSEIVDLFYSTVYYNDVYQETKGKIDFLSLFNYIFNTILKTDCIMSNDLEKLDKKIDMLIDKFLMYISYIISAHPDFIELMVGNNTFIKYIESCRDANLNTRCSFIMAIYSSIDLYDRFVLQEIVERDIIKSLDSLLDISDVNTIKYFCHILNRIIDFISDSGTQKRKFSELVFPLHGFEEISDNKSSIPDENTVEDVIVTEKRLMKFVDEL